MITVEAKCNNCKKLQLFRVDPMSIVFMALCKINCLNCKSISWDAHSIKIPSKVGWS